jgi:glutamate synthase domain-containing protein 3
MTADSNNTVIIDASGIYYRELNEKLRELIASGTHNIELSNVCGQRYIGTDLDKPVNIDIYGTPGNDLGAFMDGPSITVYGNAQDGCGNTMNEGKIVVHGHAGDITGLSARGGKIFIQDGVGYRAGIHMKEYKEKKPILVIGGTAQDFAGEYMAGGVMVLLGLNLKEGEKHPAKFIGTGMHGGVIYFRGTVDDYQLGKEVGVAELDEKDREILNQLVAEYCSYFNYDINAVMNRNFIKLYPRYLRPYGRLYAY